MIALQCVAVCCVVMVNMALELCLFTCCSVLQHDAVNFSVVVILTLCLFACCSVLRCVAVCCSVLQWCGRHMTVAHFVVLL